MCAYWIVSRVICCRIHQGKSAVDDVFEISSTEAQCYDDVRLSFDSTITNKLQMSSSPFTDKTMSPFTLAATANAKNLSPKKSPLSSAAAAVGISRTSSGVSGAHNMPADRHISAASSFMMSDYISQLNFNSVSTTSGSTNQDSAVQWLNSFSEARTPGTGFTSPPQPVGSFTSPVNSIDDDASPPVLKPKVRRASQHTPDKSPLVTSSSGDALELGKPSVGLGQPPGSAESDAVDIEAKLSHSHTFSDSRINSTTQIFSISDTDNDLDEQSLYNRLPVYAKNTKQAPASRSDGDSSVAADRRKSHKVSKSSAKDKVSSKSGPRSAKQKAKSLEADEYEKQRAELNNAFEAACRLPSTVKGQPSSAMDTSSDSTDHQSAFHSHKVSCVSFVYFY